jgi:hypothetical protein
VGPNSRMPISRPWLPMYGRSATKRCIDKSGSRAGNWGLLRCDAAALEQRIKALHPPRKACSCGPICMGGPAWQFKKFADASSRPWLSQAWRDKVAAGFSNSASVNGDKFSTIEYFWTLSQQYGQTKAHGPTEVNWTAGFGNSCFAVRRLARGGSTRRRSRDC